LSHCRIGWLVISVLNIFARQRDVQQDGQDTNHQTKHCGNYQDAIVSRTAGRTNGRGQQFVFTYERCSIELAEALFVGER